MKKKIVALFLSLIMACSFCMTSCSIGEYQYRSAWENGKLLIALSAYIDFSDILPWLNKSVSGK